MLPGFKNADVQATLIPDSVGLLDRPIHNHGQIRVTLGDFCEELAVQLLSSRKFLARRYRTDSRVSYCPDLALYHRLRRSCKANFHLPPVCFIEVKCVGLTRSTFVYASRLAKDESFTTVHDLHYLLFSHRLDTSVCHSTYDLQVGFLRELQAVYLFPFASIHAAACTVPATPLNSSYGHSNSNPVYGVGYRLPLRLLRQYPHFSLPVKFSMPERCLFE
jgi:hypothetical protein